MIAAMGAATGMVIIAAGVGTAQQCGGQTVEPVSPPARLPDYRATIQAPTPTRNPEGSGEDRTVWVDDADVERLKEWARDRGWLAAVAAATRGDARRLDRFLKEGDAMGRCHAEADREMDAMAEAGNLLGDTAGLTRRATGCIEKALDRPETREMGAGTKREALGTLLTAHSNAANPATAVTAAEPSPENMAIWRTIWPHQHECRSQIPAFAAAAAKAATPEETEDAVRQGFIEIEECLQRVVIELTAPGN